MLLLPQGTNSHRAFNARWVEKIAAAYWLDEEDLKAEAAGDLAYDDIE